MTYCDANHKYLCAKQRFCRIGTTGCFAAAGCLKWEVEYKLREEHLSAVYSIGQSLDVINISLEGIAQNPIVDVHLINHFTPSGMSIVMRSDNSSFICPDSAHTFMATPSRLGDVQTNANKTFHLSWGQTQCRAQAEIGVSCETIVPYSRSIEQICKKLPYQLGSYFLSVRDGNLEAAMENNLEVTLKDPIDRPKNDGNCRVIDWGTRQHGSIQTVT